MAQSPPAFVPNAADFARALAGATVAETARLADAHLRAGQPVHAGMVCAAARRLGLVDPSLHLVEATAHFASGERVLAVQLLDALLSRTPENLQARFLMAQFQAALGDRNQSLSWLAGVVEDYPDFPGAHELIATLLMPGLPYRDVLRRLHERLTPRAYLEIGVETGASLAMAKTASIAVGVDPEAQRVQVPLPPNARVYEVESDRFFAEETRESVFAGRPVDLTFVDGLHWFEYALRDVMNAERWSSPSGTVVLHDALPVTRISARRERASTFWAGDVWKALEALLEYRPDLRVRTILTPPSGLVVIRGLDPGSTVLASRMVEIVERYENLEYPYEPGAWPARYRTVPATEAGIQEALGLA